MKAVAFLLSLLVVSVYGQDRSSRYYMDRSKSLLDQNMVTAAEMYADSALLVSARSGHLDSLMKAYELLYAVHAKNKDFEKALGDFKLKEVYRDSMTSIKKQSELEALRLSNESEKIAHQNDVELFREEVNTMREVARQEWRNTLLTMGGMLALLALTIAMIYRERNRMKETLKQSDADLQQLRIFKEKLFTVLSYDLRTSLSSFENLAQGLSVQLETLNKEESVQILNKLYTTAGELKTTLNNVIHWVALQAGSKPFQPMSFDCKLVAERLMEKFRLHFSDKKLHAEIFIPDGQLVYADQEMIEIILENLLSNAIHFTQSGGAITCFSGRKDGLVTIGVKDTGVGITDEGIEKLFKQAADFRSIGKQNHKGVGVGLILSKELVERNGGRMYVESTVGQGSTFYFTLPEKKFS